MFGREQRRKEQEHWKEQCRKIEEFNKVIPICPDCTHALGFNFEESCGDPYSLTCLLMKSGDVMCYNSIWNRKVTKCTQYVERKK